MTYPPIEFANLDLSGEYGSTEVEQRALLLKKARKYMPELLDLISRQFPRFFLICNELFQAPMPCVDKSGHLGVSLGALQIFSVPDPEPAFLPSLQFCLSGKCTIVEPSHCSKDEHLQEILKEIISAD